jgi:hypothetical protein
MTSRRTTSAQHADRQPEASMRRASHGNRSIEPMPTPENAIPTARPRRRTNQCGRNSEWPMYVMKIEPPPTSAPSVTCRCHGRVVSGASANPRLVIARPIGMTTRGPKRSIARPRNGT